MFRFSACASEQEHVTGGGLSRILDPGPISEPSDFLLLSQTR